MQGEILIDGFYDPRRQRQRLALCMAVSATLVVLLLEWLGWPAIGPLRLPLPVLELILEPAREVAAPAERREARPETPPAGQPATETAQARPATAAAADAVAPAVPEGSVEATAAAPVDWYAELERAAAAVGERAASEPQSMHPEFDELRRIAKLYYAEPQVNPPPETWEVEKDPYGRTLLKKGPFYQVLDDPRLFNREAFEIFERHMIFVSIPLGRRKPKNLPWVETIRARYEYLREPDELPPLKGVGSTADP